MPTKTRVTTALLAATTPLIAATAAPPPTAAQQTLLRVLVATHAVCRAGPSRTAEVVALLVPRGDRGGNRAMVDASALLSLRRLELLDRAMSTVGGPGPWQPALAELDPLVRAWVELFGDQVVYSSRLQWRVSREAGRWSLRDEAVLNLYEQYRGQPEAHEILWGLA